MWPIEFGPIDDVRIRVEAVVAVTAGLLAATPRRG
jgi:hypothetical protein